MKCNCGNPKTRRGTAVHLPNCSAFLDRWQDQIALIIHEWVCRLISRGDLSMKEQQILFRFVCPEIEPFIEKLLEDEKSGYEKGFQFAKSSTLLRVEIQIDSLIQEIKQDPTISISQRNYAIKKMEELKERL